MLANMDNVVPLTRDDKFNITKYFENFLARKARKNPRTAEEYGRDIKEYWNLIYKKELHMMTSEEIVEMDIEQIEQFQDILSKERKLANGTVNRKVTAIKEFMEYLSSLKELRYLNLNTTYFNLLIRLSQNNRNSHGVLRVNEVFEMADWIAENDQEYGLMKKYLMLFSLDTCIRIGAVLNLKWTDFEEKDDFVLIKAVDKGNKDYRPKISKDFYQELLSIKVEGQNKVFNTSTGSVQRMMDKLKKEFKIPKERNIVFHSIRKAGGTFQYRLTGDILQAKKALNHSSLDTTMMYMQDEDFGIVGAVSSLGKVDKDLYNNVDIETLKKAISNLPKDAQYQINLAIHALCNK